MSLLNIYLPTIARLEGELTGEGFSTNLLILALEKGLRCFPLISIIP